MIYGDDAGLDPSAVDQAMSLLTETDWDQSVDVLRPLRNDICEQLGIPPPKVVQKKSNTSVNS